MIVRGRVMALPQANIDTDQMFPGRYLTLISRQGFGKMLFEGLPGGRDMLDKHSGATILVTGENIGCGSSREHAVWALQARGFKAVIAPSFARIFEENAYNNAFVLATVPADAIEAVFASPYARLDVGAQVLTLADGTTIQFTLDPLRKEFLLGGGFLSYMAAQIPTIRAWEAGAKR